MRFLLLAAIVSMALAADQDEQEAKVEVNKDELKPQESSHLEGGHSFRDGLELMRYREQRLHADHYRVAGHDLNQDHPAARGLEDSKHGGPIILRTPGPLPHDGHPDIEVQNKIIADVYSPDYYQPTWVLDYRYLKTGGRDYTRGPGGQILILPKGVHSDDQHKEFPDYDAYLEHLRLSRLSEKQHHRQEHRVEPHDFWHGHHRGYGAHRHDDRHEHGHSQTLWHKYG